MPGKEEWVLVWLGSQHKCVGRPVRPVFPDYPFLVTMIRSMEIKKKQKMLDFDFKKRHMKEEKDIALMENNKGY